MDPTQSVIFGPEADGFADALRTLCDRSPAVIITQHAGERFGAVLVSAEGGVLIYERWDEATGQPRGEPGTVEIEEIGPRDHKFGGPAVIVWI